MKLYTNISLLYTYSITPNAQRQPALMVQMVLTPLGPLGLFHRRTMVHVQGSSLLQQLSLENSMWNQSVPVSRRRIGSALNVHVGYCLKSCPSCYRLEAVAVGDDTLRLPY